MPLEIATKDKPYNLFVDLKTKDSASKEKKREVAKGRQIADTFDPCFKKTADKVDFH